MREAHTVGEEGGRTSRLPRDCRMAGPGPPAIRDHSPPATEPGTHHVHSPAARPSPPWSASGPPPGHRHARGPPGGAVVWGGLHNRNTSGDEPVPMCSSQCVPGMGRRHSSTSSARGRRHARAHSPPHLQRRQQLSRELPHLQPLVDHGLVADAGRARPELQALQALVRVLPHVRQAQDERRLGVAAQGLLRARAYEAWVQVRAHVRLRPVQ